ncbi:uncharacterized protein METZ01_LOCUS176203 [marine metagenome]|uniref:N-sulphoglucosamine sulphohydrolase C-terminal domain-containing protein n=1 Tax=marine metagenome TaxID=408172 RepID=A0A382CBX8_9ZZZZ
MTEQPNIILVINDQQRFDTINALGEEDGKLYDLDSDPDELVNLWTSQDHADIRKEKEALIQDEIIRQMLHAQSRLKEKHQPYMVTK